MTDYKDVIKDLIQTQEENFGPVALEYAEDIEGIKIGEEGTISVDGDDERILIEIIKEFHELVGETISSSLENKEIDKDLEAQLSEYTGRKKD